MPETTGTDGATTTVATPGGTDPTKTGTEAPTTLDLSKVSDDEFGKVFEDKRLFNHPRFKELADAKQALKAREAEEAKKEEERLKKQGEFEQLAQKREEEANNWRSKYENSIVDNRIVIEAQKAGVIDTEAVLKLIERANLKPDENGNVAGVEEAVKKLVEAKPYLKSGTTQPKIGADANPGGANNNSVKRFKHSEIQNPAFFAAHEKEIMESMKAGMIEDDIRH